MSYDSYYQVLKNDKANGKAQNQFVDFWYGFQLQRSFFYQVLSKLYALEISDDPDILFYSVYGKKYLTFDCIRIFYTAENIRPDYTGCDFAISFDYTGDHRHFRLPLYALYVHQTSGLLKQLLQPKTKEEALELWRSKKKFCCMIVSNPNAEKRINFFKKLSSYKPVDSGGRVLNNVGGAVADKLEFIKDYRFVFAFENESHPGYTTEKILEPLMAQCIPLYWGNPLVGNDFNREAFLNLDKSKTEEQFIQEIVELDNDESKAVKMLMQPGFSNGKIPSDIDEERLSQFIHKIVVNRGRIKPVAKGWRKYIHLIKTKKAYYVKRFKLILVSDHFRRAKKASAGVSAG